MRTNQPHVAMFRSEEPWSPREYFAREATRTRVTLWAVDAALIAAVATGIVLATRRKSFTSDL